MSALAALSVFAGFSLNLLLQLGLGIRDLGAKPERSIRFSLFQGAALFFPVLLFWLFFTYILSPLALGFFAFFLLFPLTVAAGKGFDLLGGRFFPALKPESGFFSIMTASDGLTIAALLMTLRLAGSFAEAVVLSLGFSLGSLFAALILKGIHQRSLLEKVPSFLRGLPLLLLSMGLLSLIFSSAAAILLQALGGD
jgi:electron transport complex protein RnfA